MLQPNTSEEWKKVVIERFMAHFQKHSESVRGEFEAAGHGENPQVDALINKAMLQLGADSRGAQLLSLMLPTVIVPAMLDTVRDFVETPETKYPQP